MSDINQKLAKFCSNLAELETMVSSFSSFYCNLTEELDDKDNVWQKLDANITNSFVNTSLFWLYLSLKNVDLTDHPIKIEVERVRKYMNNYMLLKTNAPKLNIKASQNMIRHAIWEPGSNERNKKTKHEETGGNSITTKRSRLD